eukprot:2027100-Rhodomonas_salina.3
MQGAARMHHLDMSACTTLRSISTESWRLGSGRGCDIQNRRRRSVSRSFSPRRHAVSASHSRCGIQC